MAREVTQASENVTVLFDELCTVCRVLARLVADESPKSWHFKAWQSFTVPVAAPSTWHEKHPSELRVFTDGRFFEGEKAWLYLIEHNPRLKAYQRLAAKVGLTAPIGARWLQAIGHGVRKLCWSCVYFRRS